jgi:uncharacterized protein YciI
MRPDEEEGAMPHFLVQYWDKPGSAELRPPNRDAHIAYRRGLGAKLVLAGPLFEDFDGKPAVGTMVIIDAENKDEAGAIAREDPYYKAGVFKDMQVFAHRILVLNPPEE